MASLVFLCAGGGFSPLLFLQIASAERESVCVSGEGETCGHKGSWSADIMSDVF